MAIGLGLSAAAGFRILIPFLAMAIAANLGKLQLAPEMALGSRDAMVAFAIAAVIEVLVYFVPVVANFMDMIEVPAAAIAGTILTATVTSNLDPLFRWSLAAIAGGGIAAGTEAFMGVRGVASTVAAGPVGSVAVSTGKLASSSMLSIVAILLLILTAAILVILLFLIFRRLRKRPGRRYRY